MDEYSRELNDLVWIVPVVLLLAGRLKVHHHQVVEPSAHVFEDF